MANYILAIDQGTTSSRAMLFNEQAQVIGHATKELAQSFPHSGWVEHDAWQIWQDCLALMQQVLSENNIKAQSIKSIGITNQRETIVAWNKETSKPIAPAIVWQDRRTADLCQQMVEQGLEKMISLKTGLLLDPYFSASKIKWLLDNTNGARKLADEHKLAVGTIDSYLLWCLTNGAIHATDATNASRTLLYNIHTLCWDEELLRYFDVPLDILPTVRNSADNFGKTADEHLGAQIPITAILGDQQAATFGQCCFEPGQGKSTFGTGCFLMVNTGDEIIKSRNRLLSTIAYQVDGKVTYALEGSVFVAGAAVQWLRDAIKLIDSAQESEQIAMTVTDTGGVYLVPAFTGLGAPYWDPLARGAIVGLTRDSGVAQIVRAALESVCYQVKDLLIAMQNDGVADFKQLKVDGGMVVNDWLMQFLADVCEVPILRSTINETTALGVALLSGYQSGIYKSFAEIQQLVQADKSYQPQLESQKVASLYQGWQQAVQQILTKSETL